MFFYIFPLSNLSFVLPIIILLHKHEQEEVVSYPEPAGFARWRICCRSRPSPRRWRRSAGWSSAGSRAPAGCSGSESPSEAPGNPQRTTPEDIDKIQSSIIRDSSHAAQYLRQSSVQQWVCVLQSVSFIHDQNLPLPPEQRGKYCVRNIRMKSISCKKTAL